MDEIKDVFSKNKKRNKEIKDVALRTLQSSRRSRPLRLNHTKIYCLFSTSFASTIIVFLKIYYIPLEFSHNGPIVKLELIVLLKVACMVHSLGGGGGGGGGRNKLYIIDRRNDQ
jgi:hypothetical protein